METSFLTEILPSILTNHFELVFYHKLGNVTTKSMEFELHLEEKNMLPPGYDESAYESKGFSPVSRIQDFPIRGQAVYLLIRCRRWRNKVTGKEIRSDYSFKSKGAKLTQELSDFLKGTS